MKIRVNKPQHDFTMVPNYVVQRSGLSADALGVLVWLMAHQDGFTLSSTQVRERFQFGRHTWLRISKELRAANALDHAVFRVSPEHSENGRHQVYGNALFVQWPEPIVSDGQNTGGVSKIDTMSKTDTSPQKHRVENQHGSGRKTDTLGYRKPDAFNKKENKNAREAEVAAKTKWLSAATGLPFGEWKARQKAE